MDTCILSLDGCSENVDTVACPSCQHVFCTSCLEKGIDIQKSLTVHCPCCKQAWSKTFVYDVLGGNRGFKTKRKRIEDAAILKQQEKYMHGTMQMVKRTREVRDLDKRIVEMGHALNDMKRDMESAKRQKSLLLSNRLTMEQGGDYKAKCNSTVGCPGYVSESADGVCELCGGQTCTRCMRYTPMGVYGDGEEDVKVSLIEMYGGRVFAMLSVVKQTHVCKEEDMETVALLKETTNACPSCKVQIEKSEGCNDMFCTNCHAEFNYRTGRLTNRANHQPERERFLMGGGVLRDSYTYPTGNQLTDVYIRMGRPPSRNMSDMDDLKELTKRRSVCEEVERLRDGKYKSVKDDVCAEVRVQYMMGEISEEIYKRTVIRKTRDNMFKEEVSKVLEEFTAGSKDAFNKFVNSKNKWLPPIEELKWDLNHVIEETNKKMKGVSKVYGRAVPQIPVAEMYRGISTPRVYCV